MIVEYDQQPKFTQAIDIVDAGNTCLLCTNLEGFEYILITKTICGFAYFLEIGPIMPDIPTLVPDFCVQFKKIPYKENKIESEISKFINAPMKKIKEVKETIFEDVEQDIPNNILELFSEIN